MHHTYPIISILYIYIYPPCGWFQIPMLPVIKHGWLEHQLLIDICRCSSYEDPNVHGTLGSRSISQLAM